MTIRDLLTINTGWFNDYITIEKQGKTILELIPVSELHPIWLDYEVKFYYMLPHMEDAVISCYRCDYHITIAGANIFQDKTTEIDKALNERLERFN